MGDPDRKVVDPPDDAELDFDALRFLNLPYRISESFKQTESDVDAHRPSSFVSETPSQRPGSLRNSRSTPGHRLVSPATTEVPDLSTFDLLRPSAVSAFAEQAIDIGAPHTQRRWLAWVLPLSLVAATIATNFWFGFVELPFLRAPASQLRQVVAEVKSILYSGQAAQPHETTGSPYRGRMIVQDQQGLANEPVPVGISLNGGSGSEVVILDDLVEGTQLSLGTGLSATRWSLPAKDLDKAFIGAPKDFSGTMEVTAKLYSPRNDLLQTETIRLEWGARQIDKLPTFEVVPAADTPPPRASLEAAAPIAPADVVPFATTSEALTPSKGVGSPPPATADPNRSANAALLGPPVKPALSSPEIGPTQTEAAKAARLPRPAEEVEVLLRVGKRLLQEGDIESARVSLRRAAEAGSAEAALNLAMSFELPFLRRIGVAGAPDLAQAAEWYARAKELGLK